jgi:protein kinase A
MAAAESWDYQLIATYDCSFLPSIHDYNTAEPFWDFHTRKIKAVIVLANLSKFQQVESAKKLLMLFSRNPGIPLTIVVNVSEAGTASLEETLGREKMLAITTSLIEAGAVDVILKCRQDTPMAIEVAVLRTQMLWMAAESHALAQAHETLKDLGRERPEKGRACRDSSEEHEKICPWMQAGRDMHVDVPSLDPELKEELQSDLSVKVGEFYLEKPLGYGSYSQVFKARTNRQSHQYAIKVVDKEDCTSPKKVLREVKYLGKLPVHPHIAMLHRVLHSAKALYLCMDYGGPSNLYKSQVNAPGKKLGMLVAQEIFGQVAHAVHHIHNNHVCHRDLKPENIAMNGSHALLVDFGLAGDTREVHHLCCGSLPFAAPEVMTDPCQYHGAEVDAWSLGVVLFEMVRGVDSFTEMMGWQSVVNPSSKLTEQLRFHFGNGISRGSTIIQHPDISDVVKGLLRFNARNRWTLQDVCESPWVACRVPPEQSSPEPSGR